MCDIVSYWGASEASQACCIYKHFPALQGPIAGYIHLWIFSCWEEKKLDSSWILSGSHNQLSLSQCCHCGPWAQEAGYEICIVVVPQGGSVLAKSLFSSQRCSDSTIFLVHRVCGGHFKMRSVYTVIRLSHCWCVRGNHDTL